MGLWFDHVREYQNEKDKMDVHYVKYEDMLKVGNHVFIYIFFVLVLPR